MDILNNSIVDTVIEYANVKFGVELDKDALASNLKELSYSEVLGLVDAIKDEDNDKFADYIDLSAVNEGFSILPDIDREKYQERDGLEGPIQTKSGKVVYYDPKEGSYYDPDTDMYMTYDEWKALDEAITPQSAQGAMSVASMRKERNNIPGHRAEIERDDEKRDSTGARIGGVPGKRNQVATGQGARRYDKRQDPDDVQRGQNAQAAGQAQQMASANSQEIERLTHLVQGRR